MTVFVHAYKVWKWHPKLSHSFEWVVIVLQDFEVVKKLWGHAMVPFIVIDSHSFELACWKKNKKKHFGHLVNLWFDGVFSCRYESCFGIYHILCVRVTCIIIEIVIQGRSRTYWSGGQRVKWFTAKGSVVRQRNFDGECKGVFLHVWEI